MNYFISIYYNYVDHWIVYFLKFGIKGRYFKVLCKYFLNFFFTSKVTHLTNKKHIFTDNHVDIKFNFLYQWCQYYLLDLFY